MQPIGSREGAPREQRSASNERLCRSDCYTGNEGNAQTAERMTAAQAAPLAR